MSDTLKTIRKRTRIISIFLIAFWGIIVLRLFSIQVKNSETYRSYSLNMSHKEKKIIPERGIITDRNGNGLAINIKRYSLAVHPAKIKNKPAMAKIFAKILDGDYKDYIKKFNSTKPYIFIDRDISAITADSIKTNLANHLAIELEEKISRKYPYNFLAGQTLGFTNIDNIGIEGLEKSFNDKLSGTPGFRTYFRTGKGKFETRTNLPYQKPIHGKNIELTINIEYQDILHEEVVAAQKENKADKAMGILIDPHTGEILAMAQSPAIDPNNYQKYPVENRKNILLTDVFEPGSTFKIITAAAALEEGTVSPEDTIDTEKGYIIIQKRKINDHEKLPNMTFADVIRHSSNVGTIKVAQELGISNLYQYVKKFGYNSKTGIPLPGEVKGIMKNLDGWTPLRSAQISMGQGIACTAIQLIYGYATIANGGKLLQPQIIKSISDQNGKNEYTFKSRPLRQVVSEETSKTIRNLLLNTVETGTGSKAKVSGMNIAGKTGTSQKIKPEGGYSKKDYVASFVGFFPAENPKLLCAVIIDNPRGKSYYGGTVSAPVVKNIFKRVVNCSEDLFFEETPTVDVVNVEESQNKKPHQIFINNQISRSDKPFRMPNLKGLSSYNAIQRCKVHGLEPILEGSGKVVSQEPRKGKTIKAGDICKIKLSSEG